MPLPTLVIPTMQPSVAAQVTDEQLLRYAELIYDRTGIRVSSQKKTLLSNRVRRRLRETGIGSFEEYLKHLEKLRSSDPEWDAFFQEITTHETYLFRDQSQWDWFCSYLRQRSAAAVSQGPDGRGLRIWSAACSTGDEAYTAACCIAMSLTAHQRWNIKIIGTDIGAKAVAQAKAAVFEKRAMRLAPQECLRFFQAIGSAQSWKARPILSEMASFRQHNLMDRFNEQPFDIVFLKNVLIYFDTASKKKVVDNVRAAIRPGGFLVAGAAEGVTELVKDFTRIQPWLFQRPHQ